ncbi:hypothetical protein B0H17DRAFT_1187179 [Mycena rosella]|uniref:Uncharacterized protein n=1 Tax=Mycena rosella TaxID=1033263 RepID=A0AAD7FSG0_MYCRO|nr:hypothetical protein B0H17DRAFT_1187179 [Mycena rosella]
MFDSVFEREPSNDVPAAPSTPVVGATASRKRPARVLGQTASNAGGLIPEGIRRKFSGVDGWTSHVPLNFLTDDYCSFNNHAKTKQLDDTLIFDSSGSVAKEKELAFEAELTLNFDEWTQAWGRLLELIQTYVLAEFSLWRTHYENIVKAPNRSKRWALWLAYDSGIRRRALSSSIDPSILHLDLRNELEADFTGDVAGQRALETVLRELSAQGGGRPGKAPRQSDREQRASTSRTHPCDYPSRHNEGGNHSFRPPSNLRCFVCATDDPTHKSRSCVAKRLVTGKDALLISDKNGNGRKDRNGNSYCYPFNGYAGCTSGSACTRGKHWCSLCGAKNGHNAQTCPSV